MNCSCSLLQVESQRHSPKLPKAAIEHRKTTRNSKNWRQHFVQLSVKCRENPWRKLTNDLKYWNVIRIFSEVVFAMPQTIFSAERNNQIPRQIVQQITEFFFWKIVQGSNEFWVESHLSDSFFFFRKHLESWEYIDSCLSMKGFKILRCSFSDFLFSHEFPGLILLYIFLGLYKLYNVFLKYHLNLSFVVLWLH